MKLDKNHELRIKVAVHDKDGDYKMPLYDTVDDMVRDNPGDTDAVPKATFVFQVVDVRTGETPSYIPGAAYENINDAYSAWARHKLNDWSESRDVRDS